MMLTCQPVWLVNNSPIVVRVRGSALIALYKTAEYSDFLNLSNGHTYSWNAIFLAESDFVGSGCFMMLCYSIFLTLSLHLIDLCLKLFFHKFDHNLKPVLWQLFIWVLSCPINLVIWPCYIDVWLPSTFICQCMIGLPQLNFSWLMLWLDVEYPTGVHALCVVVKPSSCSLCKLVKPLFSQESWVHTLSYFAYFTLIASSIGSASLISSCVGGGTGHFLWNACIGPGRKSFPAVFFWFTLRNTDFHWSNQVSCSWVVHFWWVIFTECSIQSKVPAMWLAYVGVDGLMALCLNCFYLVLKNEPYSLAYFNTHPVDRNVGFSSISLSFPHLNSLTDSPLPFTFLELQPCHLLQSTGTPSQCPSSNVLKIILV